MGWFVKFIDSSVGKKIIMALTGLFLYLYLIVHLVANLFLLKSDGGVAFNAYAEFMSSSNNIPVRIIEIGLFLIFAYHILDGIRLWFQNYNARSVKYKVVRASENSTFFSRFMIYSGGVVFIFLALHLADFFIPHRFGSPPETMYQSVLMKFNYPVYCWFYIICMILLAFHLVHGFQSAFQSLGVRHSKYTSFIKAFGVSFSILLCIGFAIIPLYFLFTSVGGN